MNNLTFNKLYNFLEEVDEDFPIPLSHKTNLHELSKKFIDKADIFVEYSEDNEISSLVIGYIKNSQKIQKGMLFEQINWRKWYKIKIKEGKCHN